MGEFFKQRLFTIVGAVIALAVGILTGVFNLQEQLYKWLGLHIPEACILIFLVAAAIIVGLIEELIRRRKNQNQIGFDRPSERKPLAPIWSALIILLVAVVPIEIWAWYHQWPGAKGDIKLYIDRFEGEGKLEADLESRLKEGLQTELGGIVPGAVIEYLEAPEGMTKQEDRVQWACAGGATLVVYGNREQYQIRLRIKICSQSISDTLLSIFDTKISQSDLSKSIFERRGYEMLPPPDAVEMCLIDSLAPRRAEYASLLCLGLVFLFDDVGGIGIDQPYKLAEKLFENAVEMETGRGDCSLDYCQALNYLGQTRILLARGSENKVVKDSLLVMAIGNLRDVISLRPEIEDASFQLAYALQTRSEWTDGKIVASLVAEAIRVYETTISYHPLQTEAQNNLGMLYYVVGRFDEAESLYVRSLSIREARLGAKHKKIAEILSNLAVLYHSRGRFAQAE